MNKLSQILQIRKYGFSLAEALITLLIVCIITLASIPILTKKKRAMLDNQRHGYYACYWDASGKLQAKMMYNSVISDGKVVWDAEEQRYGCEFNPPSGAKNFVATIIGGGGGGAGAASIAGNLRETYTTPGYKVIEAPEFGSYEFLVVGGGGGGGSGDTQYDVRGGAGTPGEIAYASNIILNKGEKIEIEVGGGGGAADNLAETGKSGGQSYVKIDNPNIELYAAGGGGGVGYDVVDRCDFVRNRYNAAMSGYSDNTLVRFNFGCGENQKILMGTPENDKAVLSPFGGTFNYYFNQLRGGRNTDVTKVTGEDKLSAHSVTYTSYAAPANDKTSQNRDKYYNNPDLVEYNNKFGFIFNLPVKASEEVGTKWSKKTCENIDYSKCTDTEKLCYKQFNRPWGNYIGGFRTGYCYDFQNNYGAGGGGGGSIDSSEYYRDRFAFEYEVHGIAGKSGFVGMNYSSVYAGRGGEAGKVMQIPYSELPQKTLLFPGRGGRGGIASYGIRPGHLHIGQHRNETAGESGQESYIKNGTPVFGGAGAPKIDTTDEETYYTQLSTLRDYYLAGENGKLADVLTTKKETAGGHGGFNTAKINNMTPNGTRSSVFKNAAAIGSFNRIYGAGAGGGGGAACFDSAYRYISALGHGGDGTSGLVFIQW